MEKDLKKNTLVRFFKKIRFFLFSIIIIGACFPLTTKAQSADSLGLSVSPQIFELEAFPGETITKEINLRNLSKVPLPILVKVTDFTAVENSGEMEFDESLQDPIIASRKWFKIENPNFILEDKEKVNFEISVPKDAEPGGHYSVVLFEPQLPSFYFEPGQPKTVPVIGVLFLISVKTLSLEPVVVEKPIEIVEFRIPEKEKMQNLEKALASISHIFTGASAAEINIVEKNPSSFLLRIKNNDIFHQKISGKILLYNFFGNKVGEAEIKKTTILPNKTREFPADISQQTPGALKWLPASISSFLVQNTFFGQYRVALDLEGEKTNLEMNQALYFWAIPWKILFVLFSLLIILITMRKRLIAAMKVLFKR
jgi:hypothetical protein